MPWAGEKVIPEVVEADDLLGPRTTESVRCYEALLKSIIVDTQKKWVTSSLTSSTAKIFRCCAGVEYQLQLLNKNQAKSLVHETQGLVTTILELSFLNLLTTYSHFYRSTETMLSHQSFTSGTPVVCCVFF